MANPDKTTDNINTVSRDLLSIFHTHGLGPAMYRDLIEQLGSDAAIMSSSHSQRKELKLSPEIIEGLNNPDEEAIERDLEWLEGENNYILSQQSPHYPVMLREISDAPILLYVHGRLECLSDFQIAIVGSRSPTAGGLQCALEFAHTLGEAGFSITSGLALGIDGAAHEGALAAGANTIAVMGTGLDRVYPAAHRDLAHQIAQNGALVSEFALGTTPQAHHFPRRNRIISALCSGCLVVEAALKSGSLITAKHALDQGREVFAIPGSIHNPLTRGCHHMIRQGAKLVENAQDIYDELGSLLGAQLEKTSKPDTTKVRPQKELSDDYKELLEAISFDPVSIDTLSTRIELSTNQIASMLLILELDGYVNPVAGGGYARSPMITP